MSPSSSTPTTPNTPISTNPINLASFVNIYYHQPDHPQNINNYYSSAQIANGVQFRFQGSQQTLDRPFFNNTYTNAKLTNDSSSLDDNQEKQFYPVQSSSASISYSSDNKIPDDDDDKMSIISSIADEEKNEPIIKAPDFSSVIQKPTESKNKQRRNKITQEQRVKIVETWLFYEEKNKKAGKKLKTQADVAQILAKRLNNPHITGTMLSEYVNDYRDYVKEHPCASLKDWGGISYHTKSTKWSKVGNATEKEAYIVIEHLLEYFSQRPEGMPKKLSTIFCEIKKSRKVKKLAQAKLAELVKSHPGKTELRMDLVNKRFRERFSQCLKLAQEEGRYIGIKFKTPGKKEVKKSTITFSPLKQKSSVIEEISEKVRPFGSHDVVVDKNLQVLVPHPTKKGERVPIRDFKILVPELSPATLANLKVI